jgi:enoyl-CoA hydratase
VTDEILTERRGAVLWVTVNRPHARNAMTFAMYEYLYELLGEIARDDALRAIVLAGAGDRAFVAGTDIAEFRRFRSPEDALHYEERMDAVIGALETLPLPTIAAVRGSCTGGGLALASACDLRIASPSARIGFPIARTLGNCLSARNLARIVDLIGTAATKELLYTARLFDVERAQALGFFAEVVADEPALFRRAEELAAVVAGNAPLTIRATKEALRRIREQGRDFDDRALLLSCYESDDFREGMTAFLEKRPARWSGS